MKRYRVVFSEHALSDIELGVNYYNEQQKGLGKRFGKEVQNTLKLIRDNPYYSSVRYANIRCGIIKDFPFLIHYTFLPNREQFKYCQYSIHIRSLCGKKIFNRSQ